MNIWPVARAAWRSGFRRINWNCIHSKVSHPEYVHPSVRLERATLEGRIVVGAGCIVRDALLAAPDLEIGRRTSFWGPGIVLHALLHPVRIGSYCSIARNVLIQEYNHRLDRATSYFVSSNILGEGMAQDIVSSGPITIGSDVWIAANVVVCSGAEIGTGAVIGANSVVRGVVPPYAVAAGCPATVRGYRFDPEIVERLLALEWWTWPEAFIALNRRLFLESVTLATLDRVQMP